MKLGFVIPVFNEEKYLPELIDSILNQVNFSVIENIVLVDGNSTDNSKIIIQSYVKNNSKIVLVENPKRITPISLNLGAKYCLDNGSDIVQFIGGHSKLSKNFTQELCNAVEQFPDVSIFTSSLIFFQAKIKTEKLIQLHAHSILGRNFKKFIDVEKNLDGFTTGFFAVKKKVFSEIGFYNEKLIRNQDVDFALRAQNKGFIVMTFHKIKSYYKTPSELNLLFRQMYKTGIFVSVNPSTHKLKHKIPAIFFGFIFLLIAFSILFSFLGFGFLATASFYLLVIALIGYSAGCFLESLKYFFKNGITGLFLFPLFISTHFTYALGTFVGYWKKIF
ncbi:MAG: hypothetical protein C0425_08965 [Chlorobiaceae bacterium]|nr:hypothetical protein [Chlorobiaceae bacterium]MBA4310453.1 hypothetical protein [Chlorobiaceae bacterium]